jgi:hypothetical protein
VAGRRAGPVPRGAGWVDALRVPMFETEDEAIRSSVRRSGPFGDET